MSHAALVLVPPSEAKREGGRAPSTSVPRDELDEERGLVAAALAQMLDEGDPKRLGQVLGVRGALYERYANGLKDLIAGRAPLLPAWQRYEGVVWQHLAPETLSPGERRRILVPSGLYGITRASDAIADYRLKMSVRLDPLGRLDRFWRPTVSHYVARVSKGRDVVDLLPNEHVGSIDVEVLGARRYVRVEFLTQSGRAVGHDAKAAKGAFARSVVQHGLEGSAQWQWRGWRTHRSGERWSVVAPT